MHKDDPSVCLPSATTAFSSITCNFTFPNDTYSTVTTYFDPPSTFIEVKRDADATKNPVGHGERGVPFIRSVKQGENRDKNTPNKASFSFGLNERRKTASPSSGIHGFTSSILEHHHTETLHFACLRLKQWPAARL